MQIANAIVWKFLYEPQSWVLSNINSSQQYHRPLRLLPLSFLCTLSLSLSVSFFLWMCAQNRLKLWPKPVMKFSCIFQMIWFSRFVLAKQKRYAGGNFPGRSRIVIQNIDTPIMILQFAVHESSRKIVNSCKRILCATLQLFLSPFGLFFLALCSVKRQVSPWLTV